MFLCDPHPVWLHCLVCANLSFFHYNIFLNSLYLCATPHLSTFFSLFLLPNIFPSFHFLVNVITTPPIPPTRHTLTTTPDHALPLPCPTHLFFVGVIPPSTRRVQGPQPPVPDLGQDHPMPRQPGLHAGELPTQLQVVSTCRKYE